MPQIYTTTPLFIFLFSLLLTTVHASSDEEYRPRQSLYTSFLNFSDLPDFDKEGWDAHELDELPFSVPPLNAEQLNNTPLKRIRDEDEYYITSSSQTPFSTTRKKQKANIAYDYITIITNTTTGKSKNIYLKRADCYLALLNQFTTVETYIASSRLTEQTTDPSNGKNLSYNYLYGSKDKGWLTRHEDSYAITAAGIQERDKLRTYFENLNQPDEIAPDAASAPERPEFMEIAEEIRNIAPEQEAIPLSALTAEEQIQRTKHMILAEAEIMLKDLNFDNLQNTICQTLLNYASQEVERRLNNQHGLIFPHLIYTHFQQQYDWHLDFIANKKESE